MSGGVDSSVAAALLKEAGFEVWGAFLKLTDLPNFKEGEKTALKIAKTLEIPFLVLDLRKEFKKIIIDKFLEEYTAGRTPNPCVICNREIKLGILLKKALSLGFDFLATGHHVRKRNSKILKGKDKNKDQSYFLYRLTQKQLKNILFPIGDYTKDEVRKLAKKFKVSDLITSESQEICFIPKEINDFLKKHLKEKPGNIIDREGNIVGKHKGLHFYTIGQRKGIRIGGSPKPLYVLDKDLKKNILIVTQNQKDLERKELVCERVNWISGKKPKIPLRVGAKVRYRHKAGLATVKPSRNLKVVFDQPQRAITPGQSVVFYKGQELLGGGVIKDLTRF